MNWSYLYEHKQKYHSNVKLPSNLVMVSKITLPTLHNVQKIWLKNSDPMLYLVNNFQF